MIIFHLKDRKENDGRKLELTKNARMFIRYLIQDFEKKIKCSILGARRLRNEDSPLLVECFS